LYELAGQGRITFRRAGRRTVILAEDLRNLLASLPPAPIRIKPTAWNENRPSGVAHWKFHDLRWTMRTHLSALPVQDVVRELVIAHAKQGLHKVYDLHAYRDEKLGCLTLWEARLRGIVAPKLPGDLADITAERAARKVLA
jgi:hypothetical protein